MAHVTIRGDSRTTLYPVEVRWYIYILNIWQPIACSGDPDGPQQPASKEGWEGNYSPLFLRGLPVLTKYLSPRLLLPQLSVHSSRLWSRGMLTF